MDSLPPVEPLPTVSALGAASANNVLLTLAGLVPGWYVVRDLYPRFLAVEKILKNDPPGTKIQFGLALRSLELGSYFTHGHAKAWYLPEDLLAKANDMKAELIKTGGRYAALESASPEMPSEPRTMGA